MKIQSLLSEAPIFRHQSSWVEDDRPVIKMIGRDRRKSSSSALEHYSWTYAMQKLGVDCPRRWRSTFCTTSPGDSSFFGDYESMGSKGTRRVAIPSNVPVAACEDDYNYIDVPIDEFSVRPMLHILHNYDYQAKNDEDRAAALHLLTLLKAMTPFEGSDEGYQQFLVFLDGLEKFASTRQEWMDHTFGVDTFEEVIMRGAKQSLERKTIRVYKSIDDVPTGGRGLEVWFEGDYEARLVTAEDRDAENNRM